MDINTIGVATVAAIIVICYLIGMVVKATALDSKWIPIICGVCGGLTATGVNQVFKQMKSTNNEEAM